MAPRTKWVLVSAGAIAAVVLTLLGPQWIGGVNGTTYVTLDPGWQFYQKPTTLEPPGTVFRIDSDRRRYVVDFLTAVPLSGKEVMPKTQEEVSVDVGVLARLLNGSPLVQLSTEGRSVQKLQIEVVGMQRELTTDAELTPVLKEFARKVVFKSDNKYYVIRETRSAEEIRYHLSEETLQKLGGKGLLERFAMLGGNVLRTKQKETTLSQRFPERMRVMFLPERIVQTSAGLSGEPPTFGTVPVDEPLTWTDQTGN